MDAESSATIDASNLYGFFLGDTDKQRSTVVKYTKIPDFDFERSAKWSPNSYQLQPRLRRIISLDEQLRPGTTRSMKLDENAQRQNPLTTARPIRKFVTISESDESDLHPHFGRDAIKNSQQKISTSHRAVQSPINKAPRSNDRLKNSTNTVRDVKVSAESNEIDKASNSSRSTARSRLYAPPHVSSLAASPGNSQEAKGEHVVKSRYLNFRDKESISSNPRNSVTNKSGKSNESEQSVAKQKYRYLRSDRMRSKQLEGGVQRQPQPRSKTPMLTVKKEVTSRKELSTVIEVPLETKPSVRFIRRAVSPAKRLPSVRSSAISRRDLSPLANDPRMEEKRALKEKNNVAQLKDCNTQMSILYLDSHTNTEPSPRTLHQLTNTQELPTVDQDTQCSGPDNRTVFDNLHIPNVSLTKDKSDHKLILTALSLPNLQIPPLDISTHGKLDSVRTDRSFIIGRATLTYTTKQKIDIQVIGNDSRDSRAANTPSPSLSAYPLSVLSVYKNELNRVSKGNGISNSSHAFKKSSAGNLKSNCSSLNINKLVKPSEIISEIRESSGRMLDGVCVSEQFERELNFIDSFFESLHYLESCSLTEKSLDLSQPDKWISNNLELDNSDYVHFLTNLENGALLDDSHTMASKSLCLLNLLIRDEQRRAKNLLFVLKMREDALTDFTKSQILWLEKKKKQDNTDISTLKKKQRGALLKLQHECGEMHRMRKALLSLSEKRKSALMKTKKNIELKLASNVDVERILCNKRKLKRSLSAERANVPLKCFELSSSCEDIMLRPNKSPNVASITSLSSAEKCIQTGDSAMDNAQACVSQLSPAAEDCVAVDGGYLNILFQDLAMPQIFSNGKQYEVNEEALKNIVNSANSVNLQDSEEVEKFIDQVKSRESTSPSTARSLVEEFDQYYKGLEEHTYSSQSDSAGTVEDEGACGCAGAEAPRAEGVPGPPTLQAGTAADATSEPSIWSAKLCVTSDATLLVPTATSLSAVSPPVPPPPAGSESPATAPPTAAAAAAAPPAATVDCEAERLRQEQIAIEREIKALEQQQCQLLAVREIPDKPPPPYTPPTDARPPRAARAFAPADLDEDRLRAYLEGERDKTAEEEGPFDVYIKDFCEEVSERNKVDQSGKPWDACNLLPRRPEIEGANVVRSTAAELNEVLSVAPTTSASGLSTRRSDHIDDILFAEWRRREPEWTALHRDEAAVKNQLFESIFQRVLCDTINEYKTNVLGLRSEDKQV